MNRSTRFLSYSFFLNACFWCYTLSLRNVRNTCWRKISTLKNPFVDQFILKYIYIYMPGRNCVSLLLYGCTTWTLTKRLKKLDDNYIRMLRAILNNSRRQYSTRHQLYSHLPPITKTIQVRRTRHAGHCWRSKDELISDVLLWTPAYDQAKAGRPARTYIQQLCEGTGCNPEDQPKAMDDREKWREVQGYPC